jgi:hypothetical protein
MITQNLPAAPPAVGCWVLACMWRAGGAAMALALRVGCGALAALLAEKDAAGAHVCIHCAACHLVPSAPSSP